VRVQATVFHFDPTTNNGDVVTDEGVLLPFSRQVLEESALRTLRPGQRLTVTVDGAGTQARVTAIGITNVGVVPKKPSRP
jgi:hypothetical protein